MGAGFFFLIILGFSFYLEGEANLISWSISSGRGFYCWRLVGMSSWSDLLSSSPSAKPPISLSIIISSKALAISLKPLIFDEKAGRFDLLFEAVLKS